MSVYSSFKIDLNNTNSTWTLIYHFIKENSKVLDVGCSSGYFDKVLIDKKKATVDGIELDPADAKKAAKVCRRLVEGNIETLNLSNTNLDSDYDVIIFADVLEHLIDPVATLKKVAKVLKPSGVIIFSIPNMANGSVRLQLLQGNLDATQTGLLDSTHLHFYTSNTIEKMINDAGLYLHKMKFTTFDTPKHIVEKALEVVGLENNKFFMEYINSGDSLAYQFIGVVGMSRPRSPITVKSLAKVVKPHDFYTQQLAEVQRDARRTFKNMVDSNKASGKIIQELQAQNELLRRRLDIIYKNPAIKIARKVRNIANGKKEK